MGKLIYAGLVFAQLFTLCAYVVVTAGAGARRSAAMPLTINHSSQPVMTICSHPSCSCPAAACKQLAASPAQGCV